MARFQIQLENLPIVVVLDSIKKAVAFNKTVREAFIDMSPEHSATWNDISLTLNGKEYLYNRLHQIGEGDFKTYMGKLISEGYSFGMYSPFEHTHF